MLQIGQDLRTGRTRYAGAQNAGSSRYVADVIPASRALNRYCLQIRCSSHTEEKLPRRKYAISISITSLCVRSGYFFTLVMEAQLYRNRCCTLRSQVISTGIAHAACTHGVDWAASRRESIAGRIVMIRSAGGWFFWLMMVANSDSDACSCLWSTSTAARARASQAASTR